MITEGGWLQGPMVRFWQPSWHAIRTWRVSSSTSRRCCTCHKPICRRKVWGGADPLSDRLLACRWSRVLRGCGRSAQSGAPSAGASPCWPAISSRQVSATKPCPGQRHWDDAAWKPLELKPAWRWSETVPVARDGDVFFLRLILHDCELLLQTPEGISPSKPLAGFHYRSRGIECLQKRSALLLRTDMDASFRTALPLGSCHSDFHELSCSCSDSESVCARRDGRSLHQDPKANAESHRLGQGHPRDWRGVLFVTRRLRTSTECCEQARKTLPSIPLGI